MASRSKRITLPWLLLTALVVATLATWGANRWVYRGGPRLVDLPEDVDYGPVYLNELAGLPACPDANSYTQPSDCPSPREQAYYRRLVERAKPYYENESDTPYALSTVWCLGDSSYRGWPFISRRTVSVVGIEFRSEDKAPRSDILFFANADGFPPTEYAGLAANFAIYFAATALLLLCGGSLLVRPMLAFCWRVSVRLSILYQRLHRPIRLKWFVLAAVLFGSLAAWWTHTFTHTVTRPSFCADLSCINLNETFGLPPSLPVCSSLDDIPDKPARMLSFCSRVCDQVEPLIQQYHTKERDLSVEVGLVGHSRGWPLTSREAVASVELIDFMLPAGKNELLRWEVNAEGDPASDSLFGLLGNWLFFSVAILVVSLALARAIFLLTCHIVQTQHNFPVVVLPTSASGDEASA